MTAQSKHLSPEVLSAFVDGQLKEIERPAVDHLNRCPSCAERTRSLGALKHAVVRTVNGAPEVFPDIEARWATLVAKPSHRSIRYVRPFRTRPVLAARRGW